MSRFEFLKETHIVFGEHTQVLYLVFQVGDTLNSHAESKTGVLLAVDAACFEHIRVNHATSENFHPSCVLAEVAAFATAQVT